MSSRGDETLKFDKYKGHPPYCTCVSCVKKRKRPRNLSLEQIRQLDKQDEIDKMVDKLNW